MTKSTKAQHLWFLTILMTIMGLMLLACSSTPEVNSRPPLEKQILRMRNGYIGLTNQYCKKGDDNNCQLWDVLEYKLSDPDVRKLLNDLSFGCKIGNKLYHVCPNKPGFCRNKRSGFIFKKTKEVDYIPISKHKYLRDAHTRCANLKSLGFMIL